MTQESKPDQGEASSYPEVNSIKPTDDTPYIQPIIGKLGWDTREEYKGLFGLGASSNNGVDFHVYLSFAGINFDDEAIDNIWNNGTADKVKQEIDSATAEIPDAVSAANEAVKRADSAVAASKVNSDAVAAQSAATSEAIASAASALDYANSAMKDTAKLSSDLASASAAMASETADIRKDFSDGLKSAQAAVDDVKVVVAANSAAIIKNKNSIELQQQTASSAIADLKIADGKIEQVAKNASSQAVVATQTATKAQTTAMDASSNATVAEQTASAASVIASGANDQVAAATLTASEAKVMATNASSAATSATVAASGATLTATNANSQAMQAVAQASQAAVTLTEVEKKANDGADQIKKLSANLSITQKQIAETAKQTDLDKLTGRVTTQEAQSKLLSDQMSSKISRADMTDYVDGKGFATETYTQNLMKSTADTWGVNLTKLTKTVNDNQAASVKQMTNLQASLDGLQTTVTDNSKKTSSQYSQLSDALQAKVSQKDYEAKISELLGDINLRVKSKDLISQINLEAGNTLIQSNKIYLDAGSTVFGGRAFIPSAAIKNLDASKLTFYGSGSTYATIGSSVQQYDDDKLKSTINLQYNGGLELHSSNELGSILTMHDDTIRLAVKSQVYGSGSGLPVNKQYSGVWFGNSYTLMNTVDKEGTTSGISIGVGGSVNNDYRVVLYDGSKDNRTVWGKKVGSQRFDVYTGNANLFIGPDKAEMRGKDYATVHSDNNTYIEGKNSQIHLSDGNVWIGNPANRGATGLHVTVQGWGTFSGYVEAMGWTTKSTLSSKTRIQPLDTAKALATVNATDLTTFQYKTEVAEGMTKRHAGPVIDDVHDVAQYNTPDVFVAENRQGRSDADIIGYLMGAVQELSKQLNEVKEKI